MSTPLIVIAVWVGLDAALLAAWVGGRLVYEHHRPSAAVADIGGQHFSLPEHPSLRRSA